MIITITITITIIGVALENLGKVQEAIECYDRVIEIDGSRSQTALVNKELLYFKFQQQEQLQQLEKTE